MPRYSQEEMADFGWDRNYETFDAPDDEPVGTCFACDAKVLAEDLTLDGKHLVCPSCIEDWKQQEAVEMAEKVTPLRADCATPDCDSDDLQEVA